MSLFLKEFVENQSTLSVGENGTLEYTAEGVDDPRVVLFASTVRNTPFSRVQGMVQDIISKSSSENDVIMLSDLIVLAVQTRDCRGGKGERRIFYWILIELARSGYLNTVKAMILLFPHFGYWKDLFSFLEVAQHGTMQVEQRPPPSRNTSAPPSQRRRTQAPVSIDPAMLAEPLAANQVEELTQAVIEIVGMQMRRDLSELARYESGEVSHVPSLSLLSKYLPRESKHFDKRLPGLVKRLANTIFPDAGQGALVMYRKRVAEATALLGTPEVLMCANRWEELKFDHIASICMTRNLKTFLKHDDSGALRQAALEKKIKGKQSAPHELVQAVQKAGRDEMAKLVCDAQWSSMRDEVKKQIQEQQERLQKQPAETEKPQAQGGLGRLVPLVDVSGSMNGIPMTVAIALGILTSELTVEGFRDSIITFESAPRWVELSGDLSTKVNTCKRAPWGGSTDFTRALTLILERCVTLKLAPEDVPDLIVFSDMQFDEARGASWSSKTPAWHTAFEEMALRFHRAGMEAVGQPYLCPTITFWNLRGDTTGFMARADTPGVRMLSGFSPAMLKLLIEGEGEEEEEEEAEDEIATDVDGENLVVAKARKPKITPYQTLRKAIDDPCYDVVRHLAASVGEGQFQSLASSLDNESVAAQLLEYFKGNLEARGAQERLGELSAPTAAEDTS